MKEHEKNTLVLGASTNPQRYSHRAIEMLADHGYSVVPVGNQNGAVKAIPVEQELPMEKDIHTVTLYLNQQRQQQYYEQILALQPQRLIFNPGSENDEFEKMASEQGIETVEACTLVMLSTGTY
jgi:predicted CoA-binding protein